MQLNFTQDYILEDNFVRLSPLEMAHLLPLRPLANDDELWKYFLEKGQSKAQFKIYINRALKERTIKKEYPFVVFDKLTQQYAGMTRFYDYSADLQTIKLGHTWYGKAFRGTGINKHCKYLLFEFAFEKLLMERIGFGAYASNTVSLAAMKSVGCRQEGVLRNLFPAIDKDGRTDCALFSILQIEWQLEAKAKLKTKLRKL